MSNYFIYRNTGLQLKNQKTKSKTFIIVVAVAAADNERMTEINKTGIIIIKKR